MEHEGGLAGQGANNQRHSNSQDQQQRGIGRSLRPRTAVPPTALVADMGDGSLFLQGWQDGSSAYLSLADAVPLRRELASAFGSTDPAPSNGGGESL